MTSLLMQTYSGFKKKGRLICSFIFISFYIQNASAQNSTVNARIRELHLMLDSAKYDTSKVRIFSQLSASTVHQSTRTSLSYAFKALSLAYGNPALTPKETLYIKAMSYGALALAYDKMARYTDALFYALLSKEIYERLGKEQSHDYAKILNTLGNIYSNLNNRVLAQRYYEKVLYVLKRISMENSAISVYINLGALFDNKKDYQTAISYFKKALQQSRKINDRQSISSSLINMSSSYNDDNQPDSAQKYADLALPYSIKSGNLYHLCTCYLNLGKIALAKNELEKARKYLLLSKKYADGSGIKIRQVEIYQPLYELYKKKKDYAAALKYHELYKISADSILNSKVYQTINDVAATAEITKRDQQIILLNKDKQIGDIQIRQQDLLRNSLITVIVLILVVCITLLWNVKQKQKTNKLLSSKNIQIESQRLEIEEKNETLNSINKELIMENNAAKYEVLKSKTNPHFLFNSMSTLATIVMQDQQLAIEYIGRFSDLYRKILKTESKSLVTLKEELQVVDYYLYLQKMRFEDKMHIHIDISPAVTELLVPPFSVQMMVENAIKHNSITKYENLDLHIYTKEGFVYIRNNLQKKHAPSDSTLIGQRNITDRYMLLTDKKPEFIETQQEYIVKLPLISPDAVVKKT